VQNISNNGILKPLQQKVTKCAYWLHCLSVYISHITIRKTLNGFALNMILEIFSATSRHIPSSGKIQHQGIVIYKRFCTHRRHNSLYIYRS